MALNRKQTKQAKDLYRTYSALESVPEASRLGINAAFAYQDGKYDDALKMAVESLKYSGESNIYVRNLLGKIYAKLGMHDEAIMCFATAEQLSAPNLERLVQMAESQVSSGQIEDAKETVEKAQEVDKDSSLIVEANAKIALAGGDLQGAKNLLSQMESLSDMVAFANNHAVMLAQRGSAQASVDMYQRVLDSLPDKQKQIKAIVAYNLALAHIRTGENEKAVKVLESISQGKSPVQQKAASLFSRMTLSIKEGKPINLQLVESNTTDKKHDEESLLAMDIKPGEMCCYRVFYTPGGMDEKVKELIKNPPRFKRKA